MIKTENLYRKEFEPPWSFIIRAHEWLQEKAKDYPVRSYELSAPATGKAYNKATITYWIGDK